MEEVWKPFYNFEDYEISSLGNYRSKERIIVKRDVYGNSKPFKIKSRKLSLSSSGYAANMYFQLRINRKSIRFAFVKTMLAHFPDTPEEILKMRLACDDRAKNLGKTVNARNSLRYFDKDYVFIKGKKNTYSRSSIPKQSELSPLIQRETFTEGVVNKPQDNRKLKAISIEGNLFSAQGGNYKPLEVAVQELKKR